MLTDLACKSLIKKSVSENKELKKFDHGGLYLHATPNGLAIWKYKYRLFDKEKKVSIGPYPAFSLLEARDKRHEFAKLVLAHKDPVQVKQQEKQAAKDKQDDTLQRIGEEWYANSVAGWKPRYATTIKTRLENDIYPEIGHLPVGDVTAPVLLAALRKIEARKALTVARKCLGYVGNIFRYANITGRKANDVSTSLYDALQRRKVTHHRAMEAEDLPDFLYAFERNEANMSKATRNLVEMILHTFVRTDELRRAEKAHFHFDHNQWRIPGAWMKMDEDHIVPLSRQMVSVIKTQMSYFPKSPYLFPSVQRRAKYMSAGTINAALETLGFSDKHTGHGFRALAKSTLMEKLKYSEPVADVQLAHIPKSRNGRAYDRAKFLDERKIMMQDWSDYLDQCKIKGLQKALEKKKE